MSEAIEIQQQQGEWLAVSKVRERVNAIQNLLENVMKKDVHYGVIPGTKKPSLWKPGSEQILSMFQMEVDPIVEDLSTADESRFRVLCRLTRGGKFLGAGIGEASSNEAKYKWRSVVSKAEWAWYQQNAPERSRIKFAYGDKQIEQVRTEIADVSNTILKMAKKRAQVDATLTVTGCSDIFDQDIEDIPEEMRDEFNQDAPQQPIKQTTKKVAPTPPAPKPAQPAVEPTLHLRNTGEPVISDAQRKRLFAIQGSIGMPDSILKKWLSEQGISSRSLVPVALYDQTIDYIDPDFQFHPRPAEEPF